MSVSSRSEILPKLPKEVGGYTIQAALGKGGMSTLYLALHPKTQEPIVIKVLSPKYLSSPEGVSRFFQEAKIIEVTTHPNIVKLYGYGKWEGGVYIAMEFIQGITLREMILQQATSLKRSVEIILQVSHAVAHLHVHGIRHRDLKPENIMLTMQGGIKVIDFGVAQLVNPDSVEKHLVGTPFYMSPEARTNPASASFSADIYSLGVILYEMILGRLSHGSIQLSLMPKGVQKILQKALQPDPKARYKDIIDFIHDLSLYLDSDDINRDLRGVDYMGELNEDLKEAQTLLIPKVVPQWKRIEIGFASNSNMAISAIYYDFFQSREGVYHVVMGESLATGVKGLLEISTLRGMVHALSRRITDVTELVGELNRVLIELNVEYPYTFTFLTLIPSEERISYIACGYTPLWILPASSGTPRQLTSENVALGIESNAEFMEIDTNWAIADSLLLHTFQAGSAKSIQDVKQDEKLFVESLKENAFLVPQKQVDAIFRKISGKEKGLLSQKMMTIICLKRLS